MHQPTQVYGRLANVHDQQGRYDDALGLLRRMNLAE